MKILLIGATGMIGSAILAEAVARGHDVTAAVRHPEKVSQRDRVTAVGLDVGDVANLSALAAGTDVVIAAASPRSTDNAQAEALAYAEALIAGLGKTRLVMVGGAGTLNFADGTPVCDRAPEAYAAEAKGMRAAYERIAASDLDYTVFAPAGMIAPGERTGSFRTSAGRTLLTDADGDSRISTEDYAVALMDEVETPQHRREIFTVAY